MDQIYVLVKSYTDNSGYAIVGATTSEAVAQAFDAAGQDGAAVSLAYLVPVDKPILGYYQGIQPHSFVEAK